MNEREKESGLPSVTSKPTGCSRFTDHYFDILVGGQPSGIKRVTRVSDEGSVSDVLLAPGGDFDVLASGWAAAKEWVLARNAKETP